VSDSVLFYARFGGHIERHSLEYLYFARRNSIHRFNLRQIEKNRFPVKCQCAVCGEVFLCGGIEQCLRRQYYRGPDKNGVRHVCGGCDLENKLRVAAGTLFHLISAVPQAERDRNEIYPGEFRGKIPLQPDFNWRSPVALRDYSEGTRLLNKFGQYEFAYRQLGGPVSAGRDSHVALWLWQQLTSPTGSGRLFGRGKPPYPTSSSREGATGILGASRKQASQ
jgi:hypothetical protein